ncbi:MAG: hypothetical protein AB8B66_04725 [Rickettsiaceae bacterium]
MIKRIILLLVLCGYATNGMASWWSAVTNCLDNLCDCGISPKIRWEHWDGKRLNKGDKNTLCPPYNKSGGRKDNICLVKNSYPGRWIGYYENLCGEETPESTYKEPKIRVRGQQCNAAACWSTDTTLKWNGECVTLPGGYVYPLHRMCARLAMPADTVNNRNADPGYTYGQHLNSQGATKPDKPIKTVDGKEIILEPPKLCIYYDPSVFSLDGLDVMDFNPNKQSFHKTKQLHPIVQVIIFFVDNATSFAESPFSLISSLFGMLDNGKDGDTTMAHLMSDLFSAFGSLIEKFGQVVVAMIKAIGGINRSVHSTVYGCVNLPMGPYPPPYCEKVKPFFQVASVQKICPIGDNGIAVNSVQGQECVVSTLRNNYIHNSIRVGYEDLVPLCRDNKYEKDTDKCVAIENIDSVTAAKALHVLTARRDIIKPCGKAASGEPCVRSNFQHHCSVTKDGCQDGFRVVYGTTLGGVVTPSAYFYDDISDCPSSTSAQCQKIWGINLSEFVDVNMQFSNTETIYNTTSLSSHVSIADKEQRKVNFIASIVRVAEEKTLGISKSFMQQPSQTCVFEGMGRLVGCQERAPEPEVFVYECGINGINCSSNYFEPQFVVSYQSSYKTESAASDVAVDKTSAVIAPESVYNDSSLNNIVNLAGQEFDAFVTGKSLLVKPFSGTKSPNPASLFGTYKDNVLPIKNNKVNPDALYLEGLEYINDKYHLGGKYTCVSNTNNNKKCPDDPNLCVLARYSDYNTVKCSQFIAKAKKYGNFALCSPQQSIMCTAKDSMHMMYNKGNILIRTCADSTACYEWSEELCKISMIPSDRKEPSASLGEHLQRNQYYDPFEVDPKNHQNKKFKPYDQDLYGIRNKTALELGQCVAVPQGRCKEQNDYSEENGYAYWPAVQVEKYSHGICKKGWEPLPGQTLIRQCIASSETKDFSLMPLYDMAKDPMTGGMVRKYNNIRCQKKNPADQIKDSIGDAIKDIGNLFNK